MPRRHLYGLAVLLAARNGCAGSASSNTTRDASSRELKGGVLSGLINGGATQAAAPPQSAEATKALATAKQLYDPLMEQAFAALAKLAYCGPGPTTLAPYGNPAVFPQLAEDSCGKFCKDAGFQIGNVMLVAMPQNGQKNADFGYISQVVPAKAGQKAPFQCVVAFRGTMVNPANMQTNQDHNLVNLTTPSCTPGAGCQVVSGTFQMWNTVADGVLKSLQTLGCGPGSTIAVTGHSLGAQLAAIAMFMLQDVWGYKVATSYTFEGPKPFNQQAVQVFESKMGSGGVSYFRVTNTNDQITRYPPSNNIMQPGFQVWHNVPGNASKYVLCGNQLINPTCGTLGIPDNQLCKMSDGNPSWLQCGGYAPYNGPHCGVPSAPQGNICSMTGMNQAAYVAGMVNTCMMGTEPLKAKGPQPQAALQVFPPEHIPPQDQMQATPAPTPAPTPMPLHKTTNPSYVPPSKKNPAPVQADCFKTNTMASPVSMFGHYAQVMDTIQDCQERCKNTAYCEMFTYFDYSQAGGQGGSCELTGGWGEYTPNMLGSIAGPKDCSMNPPSLTVSEKFALMQEYSDYIAPEYDAHYAIAAAFEKHAGDIKGMSAAKYSLGQMVCVGSAMLTLGACITLLVARTGRLAGLLGMRWSSAAARQSWVVVDESGLVTAEE